MSDLVTKFCERVLWWTPWLPCENSAKSGKASQEVTEDGLEDGVLECWSVGVLEDWRIGVLELERWSVLSLTPES
jgi:hypothetical protein